MPAHEAQAARMEGGRRIAAFAVACALTIASAYAQPTRAIAFYGFTIELSGDGSGTVITLNGQGVDDGRFNCQLSKGTVVAGSDCYENYIDGSSGGTGVDVIVFPSPAAGTCWSAGIDCSPDASQLPITLHSDELLTVFFNLRSFNVTVSRSGTGTGTVTSSPAGINCPGTCAAPFLYGTEVALTAVPNPGASFAEWDGACAGQGAACKIAIPASNTSTNAVFSSPTPPPAQTPKPPSPTRTPGYAASPPATPATSPAVAESNLATEPVVGGSPTAGPANSGLSPTPDPGVPTATTSGSDLTVIAIAIVGAGLLIAVGIGFGLYSLRRKPSV